VLYSGHPDIEAILDRARHWKNEGYKRLIASGAQPVAAAPSQQVGPPYGSCAIIDLPPSTDLLTRQKMLNEYKSATGNPSNRQIYNARNSGIHKPEFYEWLNGNLPSISETTKNFERFLREKKAPVPRSTKS
jgi:hypothetical protein